MATFTPVYGANAVTLTLTGLGTGITDGDWWFSDIQNNKDTDDAFDAILGGEITLGTSPTVDGSIDFYLAGRYNTGANDIGGGIGTGLPGPGEKTEGTNFKKEGLIPCGPPIIVPASASGLVMRFNIGSVAAWFGGTLPIGWVFGLQNNTGVALAGSGHAIEYFTHKTESSA